MIYYFRCTIELLYAVLHGFCVRRGYKFQSHEDADGQFDSEHMGSLCSKSSNYEGDHIVLSNPTNEANVGGRHAHPDPREAAAEAAERRLRDVSYYIFGFPFVDSEGFLNCVPQTQRKGVHDANPKRGQLAQQLAKQNSIRGAAEPQLPERLIVRPCSLWSHASLIRSAVRLI